MASKYQSKKQDKTKGNAKSKSTKPLVMRDLRAPAFLYTSECCGELAKKSACVINRSVEFEDRKASLGKWRCSKCRRPCKVTRKLNKEGVIPFSTTAATKAVEE
jgi:hypothetical protein